jgi:hypothetical protein
VARSIGGDNDEMDTTQNDDEDRREDVEAALDDLESADPAEAPDVAERLADSLTRALDEAEPNAEASPLPDREAAD